MSEHWSLPMIRASLSFSFRLHFLCYTSSCMPSRLLHLKVPHILYSMHVWYCMHLNHGISTSSPDYLYCLLVYDMLHSHTVCQFHTQPVSYCKPTQDHITQLCQSSMLKLVLFPGFHSAFCWYCKEGYHSTCVYTPHSFTSN